MFRLAHITARQNAIQAVQAAPDGYIVTVREPTRSGEQNAKLWAILSEFSAQLVWPVNGHMVQMTAEEWKAVLSAAFRKEQSRLAMGLDGGVVMLGARTSKMGRREFSEFLEFVQAVAVDRGVEMGEQQ